MSLPVSVSPHSKPVGRPQRPGWDALLLAGLLIARLRINSLAEAGLFEHFQNVTGHSLLGAWLSDEAEAAFGPWFGDPLALLLAALSLGALLLYLVVDVRGQDQASVAQEPREARVYRLKLVLVWAIIALTVLAPTLKLALLRHENLPHSYAHDGGVLQTEAAVDFFLNGLNPYREDYRETPMAQWGLPEFRTALDHYPYLPWTFIFSAPFQWLSLSLWGWYDQRFVYLLLFVTGLILATQLVPRHQPRSRLGLLALLGLNPIMGLDLIFGQNDLFVWAWIVFGLWLLRRARDRGRARDSEEERGGGKGWLWQGAALSFGLACASKPTAWFMAPFFLMLLVGDRPADWRELPRLLPVLWRRGWPLVAAFLLLVGPYMVWDWPAFFDDVWRWAAGTADTHYQIWGWGASNFVLAFGGLSSRFDYWPFWLPELIVTLPLLLWLGLRQLRSNRVAAACWHYGFLLLAFLYLSRFLNENYLGYILAFLAMGYFTWDQES